MPTGCSDAGPPRRVLAALLLTLVLTGCSSADDEPDPSAPPSPEATRVTAAPDVVRALTRLLEHRAAAVRRGDVVGFVAGLDDSDPAFVRAQRGYLANLRQLPLGTFGYRLDRSTMIRQGGDYWAEVAVTLELEGYDDAPVVTRDRYRFTRLRRGRLVLSSVSDPAWERLHRVRAQPWDIGPVTVRAGDGVLGIFDDGSLAHADAVVADVEAGIAAVAAELPYPWSRRVVVYVLDDSRFLAGLDDVPGDDPFRIDGLTFEVPVAPDSRRVASTRFLLSPDMLAGSDLARNRLIRHELTHVGIGGRASGVPTWLSEGIAEYVSVQPLAPQDRAVSRAALAAAERGLSTMPGDDTFNVTGSEVNYAIAWWACEYVAETYHESMLWILLEEIRNAEDPDAALRALLQVDADALARKGARLMVDTYHPRPEEESEESGWPSGSPTS